MGGWWTLSIPEQRHDTDRLEARLREHPYVRDVRSNYHHIWALVKDPGGAVDLRDVMRDTAELWETEHVVWGFASDTSGQGSAEVYRRTPDNDIEHVDEYIEKSGPEWEGRKAEAWALLTWDIDARIDWWEHFDE